MTNHKVRGLLFPEDVARIWTEEARKKDPEASALRVETVHTYVNRSKPGGFYANNPVPVAKARRGARQPAWEAEQEQALRDWWNSRRGRGAGGGRPRKVQPAPDEQRAST